MIPPLVSVIIPCYNVEEYIEECIDSDISQSYQNIEIICIDNNSTDDTFKILKKSASKYDEIILLKEFSAGAPYARNKGLEVAKGEWIQFLDADDLILEDKIKGQIKLVSKDIGFVFSPFKIRQVNGIESLSEKMNLIEDDFHLLITNNLGITSSNLYKKNLLVEIGGWNTQLNSSQETDLMFRLLKIDAKPLLDNRYETIIQKRIQGQISQQNPTNKWRTYIEVRFSVLRWLKVNRTEVFDKTKSQFKSYIIVTILILFRYSYSDSKIYLNQIDDIFNDTKVVPVSGISNIKSRMINILGHSNFCFLMNIYFKIKKRYSNVENI